MAPGGVLAGVRSAAEQDCKDTALPLGAAPRVGGLSPGCPRGGVRSAAEQDATRTALAPVGHGAGAPGDRRSVRRLAAMRATAPLSSSHRGGGRGAWGLTLTLSGQCEAPLYAQAVLSASLSLISLALRMVRITLGTMYCRPIQISIWAVVACAISWIAGFG